MKNITGFITLREVQDNDPNATSLLGELSTYSRTYSRTVNDYQNFQHPNYTLTTFRVVDDTDNLNTPLSLSATEVTEIMQVVQACRDYDNSHISPINPSDFVSSIQATMYATITNFKVGNFVSVGSMEMPAWISWTRTAVGSGTVKVWFSDSSFRTLYPYTDIIVIPPVSSVDTLMGSYTSAIAEMGGRTLGESIDLVQEAKDNHPETAFRVYSFDYLNKLNPTQSYKSQWNILVYGNAGDNIDSIKAAIVNHILANTDYEQAKWAEVLPDLFYQTEFIVLPRWDKIAINNLTVLSSIYGSLFDPNEVITFAKTNIPFYNQTHIGNHLTTIPFDYKCLSAIVVDGEINRVDKQWFKDQFTDYIPVPTTSVDFQRMSTRTQKWLLLMLELIQIAENINQATIPSYIHVTFRNNITFVSSVYEEVNYLVAASNNSFYGN